jgi:hypothetical protein
LHELPAWEYSGAVPLTNDLSVLESDLHAGRVAASERGYHEEPDSIDVEDAMLAPSGEGLLSAADAAEAGLEFVPTHTRFIMSWRREP